MGAEDAVEPLGLRIPLPRIVREPFARQGLRHLLPQAVALVDVERRGLGEDGLDRGADGLGSAGRRSSP